MPADNVELHRLLYVALNSGDPDAVVALCDPTVEIQSVFSAVGGAVYEGHDGARAWQRDLEESWGEHFRVEAQAYFDLGESTLVDAVLHGRGAQSGIDVAMPAFGACTWRDGLCVAHRAHAQRADALRELGASERTLEPIAP